MQPGSFFIEVSSARDAMPVSVAQVEITFSDGSTARAATNISGQTDTFSQMAPDPELALDPDYDGEVYSTCSVTVTAASFIQTIVNGIQIFAGDTIVVPVALQPVEIDPDSTDRTEEIIVDIPANIINDRDHENLDPPGPGFGLGVLDTAVVPENITVHLGRPDASAQNVTVRYPDYIKNVCCSEIYSTWPEAALRANIYCQISLSLNRVFTEWYRSRGYAFDITNSTQYDQYYVHGRSIAENVSKIVDEIFTQYCRMGTNVEPFYTEYCNGTTATCPGLKQWGTVTLAQQGMTALQILRNYYGNNLNITEAPVVKGIPVSYPGSPLSNGSTGTSVSAMQTWLLRIRRNYPAIPTLTVDGSFGSTTEAAVRAFQKIFSLTQDGIVGRATWNKISYIFVAVTKLAELGSEGIPGGADAPPIVDPTPSTTIRVGDTGQLVTLAQFLLNIASDFYDDIQPVGVDGVFGQATRVSVAEFQRLRNLTVDGVIGPVTWSNLYEVYYDMINASAFNPAYPGTALQNGSRGSNVQLMQTYLNYIGKFFITIPALTVDGIFGAATTTAVRSYQTLFGLTVDGIIGPTSWNSIVTTYLKLSGAVINT